VFRETFLWRFRRPEDREALIHFGKYLDNLMWEYGEAGGDEPLLWFQFRAIAADLRHLAAYLQRMAATPNHSSIDPFESAICCAAAQWSKRVEGIASEVHHAVVNTWGGAA
jgi:hypothetical protein